MSGAQSIVLGAVLGAVGGVAGAFAGYQARTRLVKALKVPDLVVAFFGRRGGRLAGAYLLCRGSKRD